MLHKDQTKKTTVGSGILLKKCLVVVFKGYLYSSPQSPGISLPLLTTEWIKAKSPSSRPVSKQVEISQHLLPDIFRARTLCRSAGRRILGMN